MIGGLISRAGSLWTAVQPVLWAILGRAAASAPHLQHFGAQCSLDRACARGHTVAVPRDQPAAGLDPPDPPSAGPEDNLGYWFLSSVSNAACSVSLIALYEAAVPTLRLSRLQVLAVAAIATAGTELASFAVSTRIGFPVPFIITLISPVYLCLLTASLAVMSGRHVRDTPKAHTSLKEWANVVLLMSAMFAVYSLCNHAFLKASPHGQTAITLLMNGLKIAYKNAVSNRIREQADRRPEIVNFFGETFNALFVTFSMQNASSTSTISVLLSVDVMHACATLYDVHRGANKIGEIENRLSGARTTRRSTVEGGEITQPASLVLPPGEGLPQSMIEKAIAILSRRGEGACPSSLSPGEDRASPVSSGATRPR